MLGFTTFLLLLPARTASLDVDTVGGPGASVTHCYTHLGWQDALGPLSCSRWGAAAVGVLVGLAVLLLSRERARRTARRPAASGTIAA